ncbi:MAG: FprA family A-type flavoprotein, partial [Deltaproteobacteria bacterium]
DRRLFDELIPLPYGTSYNSYLIKGSEKTVLIDTVDPSRGLELIDNIKKSGIKKIDYLVCNHAEQDHSGSIPIILQIYPEARVVTNQKCSDMLMDLLQIPEDRFLIVSDRDTISLGDRTLEFIIAPWVHWPETMFTHSREDRILFSCDFLGSHFASSNLFVTDEPKVYEGAKRYFAEIMMPFRTSIRKHLETIRGLDVEMIAPSHGPVYARPELILKECGKWASDEVKNEVIIAYVSMHGSTAMMVDHLVDALIDRGVVVKPFNLIKTDLGELAISLIDAATMVIASPTVLVGPHPAVAYAASLTNALRPKLKFAGIIGSYGWGGKMVEQISGMLSSLKLEMFDPVLVKGLPKEADFQALDHMADEILKKHKGSALVKGIESA